MSKNTLYSVPDCHDGEAQEKSKSAPKLGQQGGEGVGEADDESVLVGVVAELVVGAVGGQGAETNT